MFCTFYFSNLLSKDEVTFAQQVKLNRLQIKNRLIELFKNDDILQHELNITMLDARGREEEGNGVLDLPKKCLLFSLQNSFHCVP